jgi:starvation-inducible DNA-binding protein
MSTQAMKLFALHSSHLNATRNDLPEPGRFASIEALNRLMVESIDVAMCARHAHWNVRGPHFMARHQLFKSVAEGLEPQIDTIAKRISALGGFARGTPHIVASDSTLKPYPLHSVSDHDHLDAVACRLGLLAGEARISINECQKHGDPVTVHILVEANTAIEKLLWLVESHTVAPH